MGPLKHQSCSVSDNCKTQMTNKLNSGCQLCASPQTKFSNQFVCCALHWAISYDIFQELHRASRIVPSPLSCITIPDLSSNVLVSHSPLWCLSHFDDSFSTIPHQKKKKGNSGDGHIPRRRAHQPFPCKYQYIMSCTLLNVWCPSRRFHFFFCGWISRRVS